MMFTNSICCGAAGRGRSQGLCY